MLGFLLGVIVGGALGIIAMGILQDVKMYYPDEEDEEARR